MSSWSPARWPATALVASTPAYLDQASVVVWERICVTNGR